MEEFEEALKMAVPISVVMGLIFFAFMASSALYNVVFESKQTVFGFIRRAIQFMLYFLMTAVLFGISLVSFMAIMIVELFFNLLTFWLGPLY